MRRKKFSLAEHDIFLITSDPDIWSLGNQSYYEINYIKRNIATKYKSLWIGVH